MPQLEQRPQRIEGVADWLKAKAFFKNRLWTLSGGILTTIIDGTKQYYYKPKNKKS